MPRLIDADARVTVQSFDPMNEEYSHTEMSVSEALDFATDEGCPPTIDAIPVEWLGQLIQNSMDAQLHYAVATVLQAWQKEQGAR